MSNNGGQQSQQGNYVYFSHIDITESDEGLFRGLEGKITGEVLIHLGMRYPVGEIAKHVNAVQPQGAKPVKAETLSNRLQRALAKVATEKGFKREDVRAAHQAIGLSNGFQSNGKRIGAGPNPFSGHDGDDEDEDEEMEDAGEGSASVLQDNGAQSQMAAALAKQTTGERDPNRESQGKPLDLATRHDGSFRFFK